MALITLRQLLDHAAEHDYGVPAFNINNMEQGLAVMEAAASVDAPVIIQASRGARTYANDIMLAKMIEALVAIYPDIPLVMHQDHGNSEATCASAIRFGFTSVMMDGSLKADGKTPADYDYNVASPAASSISRIGSAPRSKANSACSARSRAARARRRTATAPRASSRHDQLLTDPAQAEDFVARTKVDALAIAMGTSHGAYKFTRKPDGAILAMNVVEEIHRRLPNTHLVMHGSSSVPQDLQDAFNAAGGEMPQTWGVPVDEIQRGIKYGVRKINIDTDCRIAMTAAIRATLGKNKGEFDPRKYLKPAMEAMRAVCKQRYEEFGTAGQASQDQADPAVGNGEALRQRRARSAIREQEGGGVSVHVEWRRHRALDSLGRFRAAGRGDARDGGGRRRLDSSRRDGRAFRAQHHLRARRHRGAAAADGAHARRASDDFAGRSLYRRFRRSGRRRHHRPRRERAASASLAASDPRPRQEGGRVAQSGDA